MKKIINFILPIVSAALLFANGKNDIPNSAQNAVEPKTRIVASTSWTAAFADIAGADNVETIAPATLRHPPEYEVTVSDIQKITASDLFIYAGFERMMKTLGDSIDGTKMMRIASNNSIATVTNETAKIAERLGTEEKNKARLALYVNRAARKIECKSAVPQTPALPRRRFGFYCCGDIRTGGCDGKPNRKRKTRRLRYNHRQCA